MPNVGPVYGPVAGQFPVNGTAGGGRWSGIASDKMISQQLLGPFTLRPHLHFRTSSGLPIRASLDTSVQVGLFLSCVSCHSSAEVFFLLNFFVAEGGCELFGLKDLAGLYVGLAFVGTALDPLDGLFERLDLPEPEAGDGFLAFGEVAVGDGE